MHVIYDDQSDGFAMESCRVEVWLKRLRASSAEAKEMFHVGLFSSVTGRDVKV